MISAKVCQVDSFSCVVHQLVSQTAAVLPQDGTGTLRPFFTEADESEGDQLELNANLTVHMQAKQPNL
ncbi:hypothetical protein QQP08_011915 [Theobroma cacao]|nr:hypothetical protein QQP08_011915 [Theobroma cacao]